MHTRVHTPMACTRLLSPPTCTPLAVVRAPSESSKKRHAIHFHTEVATTRRRLRNIGRRTIDPRSRSMRIWGGMTTAAYLYTAFVTPFEAGFLEYSSGFAEDRFLDYGYTCNRLIDVIFCVDVMLQFFIPYRETSRKGGMMVYNSRKIARHYLRGWFALDVLTCVPYDLAINAVLFARGEEMNTRMFRLLRMVRLLKRMRSTRPSHS